MEKSLKKKLVLGGLKRVGDFHVKKMVAEYEKLFTQVISENSTR